MNAQSYSPWISYPFTPSTEGAEDAFVIGDIVTLITGSPDMVITDVCECGEVTACWYDGNGIQFYGFPAEALVYA